MQDSQSAKTDQTARISLHHHHNVKEQREILTAPDILRLTATILSGPDDLAAGELGYTQPAAVRQHPFSPNRHFGRSLRSSSFTILRVRAKAAVSAKAKPFHPPVAWRRST